MSVRKKPKKAQKWINKEYSNKKRNEVTNISEEDICDFLGRKLVLAGPLKIEDFTKLKNIRLEKHQLTSLEIINCSQLTNIDIYYFTGPLTELKISRCPKLTKIKLPLYMEEKNSLSVSDCPELTKLDCSYNQLISLDLSNNQQLTKLDCTGNELTELDVSDCPNLIELRCSYNLIKNLILNICPEIIKLNCSNNQLINLEISNCSKLQEIISHNNPGLKISKRVTTQLRLGEDEEEEGKEKVRNLLIVGRTGGGKSTLANVLSGTDEFEESGRSVSKTKNFRKKVFNWKGIKYHVVDTIGVGDTRLTKKKVLYKIAEGIYSMPEGISQILFVVDGRFTAEEIEAFELFEKAIFETGIVEYITIVRTKFDNFKNTDECEKDKEDLCRENEIIAKIVGSCRGIVYVDNPSTKILVSDEDDREIIENYRKRREKSRTILLGYLEKECQEKYYKLKTWDKLCAKITNYVKETEPVSEDLPAIENNNIAKDVEFAFNLEFPLFKLNFDAKAKEIPCCSII